MSNKAGKCLICEGIKPLIEFKIKNKTYKICKECQKKIKHGLNHQDDLLNSVVKEDILLIRKAFLEAIGKSIEWIDNRIKFERLISSKGRGRVIKDISKCMICGSKKIHIVVPIYVKMFDSKPLKYGLPLCSSCEKRVTDVTTLL